MRCLPALPMPGAHDEHERRARDRDAQLAHGGEVRQAAVGRADVGFAEVFDVQNFKGI